MGRESGAALLPPTSLIAANKRDYLPDPCFLYTQGGRLHGHANLSAVTGAQSPRPGYPIPFAVAAHMQLARYRSVFGRILREEAHPIGCYEVKPLQKRSIFKGQRPDRKRSTRLLKCCLGPTRGVVEGGRWTRVIGTGGVCASLAVVTPVMPAAGVGVLSWPKS